ncbi:MAG: hypothetical protein HY763_11915 [Planctomycetes bacterium]|nr:hypothetical protein [Planctomycetota bacterium]
MAKQVVGPVERHLEKAVVGIAGLFLIGVIALYLVRSPNQFELDGAGGAVTPGTVYATIAQKADGVRERIKSAPAKAEQPTPLLDEFKASLNPFRGEDQMAVLRPAAPLAPEVPIIDQPSVIEGDAKLAEVVQLPKPAVVFGRSTLKVPSGTGHEFVARNWATVSAVFDRKKQAQFQAQAYGETRDEVIFAGIDLQRRTRRPDGSWSDDDWVHVATWPAARVPKAPEVSLAQEGKQLKVPQDEFSRVVKYFEAIREPKAQLEILRPLMPAWENGTKWLFPELTNKRDVMIQDQEYLGGENPPDRYGLETEAAVDAPPEEAFQATPGKAAPIPQRFKDGQKLLDGASTPGECIDAFNIFSEIFTDAAASPGDKAKAKKKMDESEQKQRDIERYIKEHGAAPQPGQGAGPEKKKKELLPAHQVWAHDADEDSLIAGKTYQYRMRVLLYNRLAGEPLLFRDKQNATVVLIEGPWSEPSDPVAVPATERFFVISCDEKKDEVTVEQFRWYDGVWVKSKEQFGIGSKLEHQARVLAPSVADRNVADRPVVAFSNDATVLDIDFKRNYREPKKGTGRGGVKFPAAEATCAVVFVDSAGNLYEHSVAGDKSHPDRAALGAVVWKEPR